MELVKCNLCGIDVVMVDDGERLHCSVSHLVNVFRCTSQKKMWEELELYYKHDDVRMEPGYGKVLATSSCAPFTHPGYSAPSEPMAYILQRTRMWSEDDMLFYAHLRGSNVYAKNFRTEFKNLLKERSRSKRPPKEPEYIYMHTNLTENVHKLTGLIQNLSERLDALENPQEVSHD